MIACGLLLLLLTNGNLFVVVVLDVAIIVAADVSYSIQLVVVT